MTHVRLATGLARSGGRVLLVASTYASHAAPLWNLPGGRQEPGELLTETVAREIAEETGLTAEIDALAYVSESYDGDTHFTNSTFLVRCRGSIREPGAGDHVVAAEWVTAREVADRLTIAVVREPLVAFLEGRLNARYAGFHEAGVTVRWPGT